MRRTVHCAGALALVICGVFLLTGVGCVQKKRIYSEPPHYSSAPAPRQAATQAAGTTAATAAPASPQPAAKAQPTSTTLQPTPNAATAADQPERLEGLASWIADDFHGLRTASGELYDKEALTGAHRTLPMNTRVEVTNLENGRSIVVRINDRGPFKQERIIDVSRRAAEQLGMIGPGVIKVRLRVLDGMATAGDGALAAPGTAAPQPAQTSESATQTADQTTRSMDSTAKATTTTPCWYVQVGAFEDRENAKRALAELYAKGYEQSRIAEMAQDGLYRVQAGTFTDRPEAETVLDQLKTNYPASFVLSSDSIQP